VAVDRRGTRLFRRYAARVGFRSRAYSLAAGNDSATREQIWKVPLCIALWRQIRPWRKRVLWWEDRNGQDCPEDRHLSRVDHAQCRRRRVRAVRPSRPRTGTPSWGAANALTDKEVLVALDSLDAAFNFRQGLDINDYLDRLKGLMKRTTVTWDMAGFRHGTACRGSVTCSRAAGPENPPWQKYILDLYGPLYAKVGIATGDADPRPRQSRRGLLRSPVANACRHVRNAFRRPRRGIGQARGAAYLGLFAGRQNPATVIKIHADAIDPNLADLAVSIAVQDLGGSGFRCNSRACEKPSGMPWVRQRLLNAA